MKAVRRVTLWTIAAVLQITLAYGQATTATIRGRVVDPQGRPVASATVTVSRQDNAISRTVSTAADGTFEVSNVPPSAVDLVVTAPGFTESKRTGLVLEVGRTTTVDIDLKVGGVRETVDVGVTASAVDTTHSVVDAVMPSSAIEALPLNGRNFLELAFLVPATRPPRTSIRPSRTASLISSAGQLGRGGNIMIDGADNNDDVVGGPLQNVTQESVQEFQIATNRFTRRIRPLGLVGHQRRHQVRHRSAPRIGVDVRAATAAWQALPATYDRSSGDDAAVRSCSSSPARSAGR